MEEFYTSIKDIEGEVRSEVYSAKGFYNNKVDKRYNKTYWYVS